MKKKINIEAMPDVDAILHLSSLSEFEQVFLFCKGFVNECIEKGVLGEKLPQTFNFPPIGKKTYDLMVAQGFKPTEQQMEYTVHSLMEKHDLVLITRED